MKELTTNQIAKLLGVSRRAVVKYLNERKIIGYKVGGRWRATEQAVYEFLELSNINLLGGYEDGEK